MTSIEMPFRGISSVRRAYMVMNQALNVARARLGTGIVLLASVVLMTSAVPQPASAQAPADPARGEAPSAPAGVVAGKAYSMLARNCAGCHQAGQLEGRQPGAGIANVLALDEIARDPSLVRPGLPDASRIYAVALTGEAHLDILNDPTIAQPTVAEVQALREWIADLTDRSAAACAGRPRVGPDAVAAAIGRVLAGIEPETARLTRFVSLVHLHNACVTDAELAGLQQAARSVLINLAAQGGRRPETGWIRAIDPQQLILAVSLADLGWSTDQWDAAATANPMRALPRLPKSVIDGTGTSTPVLAADWLALTTSRVMPRPPPQIAAGTATDAAASDRQVLIWGLPAAEALAHALRRPVGIARLAADLWIEPADLKRRLVSLPPASMLAARQLVGGSVARRATIEALIPVLGGTKHSETLPGETLTPSASASERLDIALWSNAEVYHSGDRAVFSVAITKDCYLTLINVDRSGRATVLFPNELEPANLIMRDRIVQIPAETAPYRFRFKDKGRETMVAICSTTHKAPAGIEHDYDRLRFTVLGDWQLFLREPPEMREARRDDAATDVPRPQQRRRGRTAGQKADPKSAGPDVQTRTAITIEIE